MTSSVNTQPKETSHERWLAAPIRGVLADSARGPIGLIDHGIDNRAYWTRVRSSVVSINRSSH
jgi:hypothetical protein